MRKIDRMLSDLICKQDEVTHMNAKGLEDADETRELLNERNEISARIIAYVERLENIIQTARVALL